ncbi:MAG: ATP citrate lyase citrate-binding domain-containing protein [Candidatus Peribacteraceae bacterium]|jgi:ATP-citrate lyase beta-subunit|nr:ATP citrate lyase citrate-binding domain-containing protein [Candidatus Peribacteraceae bacterium]HCI04280.1 ATPase [Candidatus Peribacteria bacterium]|tara:strand:- start:1847 stop:3205 length:1359 start_codon:yes stop_codon:yes gene_type:complete
MAQKPIREAQAKALIAANWPSDQPGRPEIRFAAVDSGTDLNELPNSQPWLRNGKIVVKADEMFGKRGKLGYVKIAENWEEAASWISDYRGKDVMIGEKVGKLNNFLIEPFVEHTSEYYLAFTCEREFDVIHFSVKGGMDIETQGDAIKTIRVPLGSSPELINTIPLSLQPTIQGLFQLFRDLDLPYLEFNPITEVGGKVYLLDTVSRADTAASFRQTKNWGNMEVPLGFGTEITPEELRIKEMDEKSGSSLKFVLLNPNGRIWTMVAGGGASIIYADAITSQADPKELANYGEWSGNPTTDEMEAYTSEILTLVERNADKEQVMIIGGGIANFTDIKKTFAGVIKALKKHQSNIKNLKIFVRRAGPNDEEGLKALQAACNELGIFCVTYGAELSMTEVVGMAVEALKLRAADEFKEEVNSEKLIVNSAPPEFNHNYKPVDSIAPTTYPPSPA